MKPVSKRAGATTIPPRTQVPAAMPNPPEANDPPPNHANVALVAAAPAKPEMAVPVEAVPKTPTNA